MAERILDTTPEAARQYFQLLREAGVQGRARALAAACRRMRLFAMAGIRQAHPGLSDAEARLGVAELLVRAESDA